MRRHGWSGVLRLAGLTWVWLVTGVGLVCAQTVSVAGLRVPAKAWQHYNLALAAQRSHSGEECERELAKAIEIAPDFAEPYLLRASRAIDARRFEPAFGDLLKAQKLNPNLPWLGVIFAEYYNGVRRFQDALLILKNLPRAEPDSWQAEYETSFAEVGLAHGEAALHWSELALAKAPEPHRELHLLHGYALALVHRWSEAQVELESYLAAPGPTTNRDQIVATLAYTQRMAARGQDSQTVASR